jgi:rhodanese-related sulfurtransferase
MGAKRSSTIGYEKKNNTALEIKDKSVFIESLTTNMPDVPDHFKRCSALNASGPELLDSLSVSKELNPAMFKEKITSGKSVVLDVRRYDAFSGQHITGSYNIDISGNFATFAGWVLPPEKDILLVTDNLEQVHEAARWLHRVGIDKVMGYLYGGMFEWSKHGLQIAHINIISAKELNDLVAKGTKITLIDVRSREEYNSFHINNAINVPVADLRHRYKEIDSTIPVALMCSTGHRSSLGASILGQHDFKYIYNLAGGMSGYGKLN